MKLTFLLLTVAALQVSATGHSQKVTLSLKNAPIEQVFREIQRQTGMGFFFTKQMLENAHPVTVQVKGVQVEEALKICFRNQPLSFTLVNGNIVVSEKNNKNEIGPQANVQVPPLIDIQGRVTGSDGRALEGANVRVKGTNTGTVTNRDGSFMLKNVSENATLEISFVGYQTRTISVKAQTQINVILQQKLALVDSMVVIAYGTSSKRLLTGNVSTVKGREIENQPLTSPITALQGRMAGVEITQLSGMPGAAPSIRIRGQNSLRYDANDPLYIIDGVPFDATPIRTQGFLLRVGSDPLSTIDLSNIQSIEVLKDADATAIYGSRGANGVVLITTKKSKPGKVTVDVNAYTGTGRVPHFVELLNTQQYLQMRREAFANSGVTPTTANAVDLLVWDTTRYTDWQKELIGGTANISNLNASVYGGSLQTTFRLGGSFQRQGTVFPGDFRYQKMTGFFNLNHRSDNNKLIAQLTANYGKDDNNLFPGGGSEMANAVFLPPNAPALYKENGELNWENTTWNNPVAAMHRPQNINSNSINLNSSLSYNLFSGFSFKTSLGYTKLNSREFNKAPKSALTPAYTQESSASLKTTERGSWIVEPQLTYIRRIGQGKLDLLVGTTFQKSETEGLGITGKGFVDESLMGNLGTAEKVTVTQSLTGKTEYKYAALFGRIGYNWQQKYLLNLTGRRDGSSRFGPGKRFANLGAVGAAWIFSEESFMQSDLPFISFGKLRSSYGITGSDQIGDYGYLDTWGTIYGTDGLYPTQLANPDYSWETNRKFEVSLDLGLFNDRINLSTSWYRNRSSNQLVGYPLSSTTGFTRVQANMAATVENKGWEFELTTSNMQKGYFTWRTSVNLSLPENKLLEYPNIEQSSYANTYRVGKPLNIGLLYQYTGLDPQTGLYTVLDVNGDSRYDTKDRIVIKTLGRHYYGGINNSLTLKNFQLDFLIEFVEQTSSANSRFMYNFPPGTVGISSSNIQGNLPLELMNRWQKAGDNTDIQKFLIATGVTQYYSYASSSDIAYNTDASFIRFKTLSVSYQLPESLVSKTGLSSCKFYVQGQNLFTITKYIGWDAQSPWTGALPALRMLTGGIQLRF